MGNGEPNDDLEDRGTGETRAADAVTIFWMIAVMQSVFFELATVVAKWYLRMHPDATQIGTLAKLFYLSAALGGCISLLLLPVVFRLRRTPPPRGVTVFSVAVATLPIITLLFGIGM